MTLDQLIKAIDDTLEVIASQLQPGLGEPTRLALDQYRLSMTFMRNEVSKMQTHPNVVELLERVDTQLAVTEKVDDPTRAAVRTALELLQPLHPVTDALVDDFAKAMRAKLLKSQRKYGYTNNWSRDGWEHECREELMRHIDKGDPLDVAIYAAFMWAKGYRPHIDGSAYVRELEKKARELSGTLDSYWNSVQRYDLDQRQYWEKAITKAQRALAHTIRSK